MTPSSGEKATLPRRGYCILRARDQRQQETSVHQAGWSVEKEYEGMDECRDKLIAAYLLRGVRIYQHSERER